MKKEYFSFLKYCEVIIDFWASNSLESLKYKAQSGGCASMGVNPY
jgi:hypothetical protein